MKATPFSLASIRENLKFVSLCFIAVLPLLFYSCASFATLGKGALFSFFLLLIAVLDYRYGMIYNRVLLPFLLLGLFLLVFDDIGALFSSFIAATIFGGFLLFLRILSRGGMGGGDIKLAFVLGFWLSPDVLIVCALLSFWAGGIVSLLLILRGQRRKTLPFAPFLAFGALCAYLYAQDLIALYQNFWGI